MRPCLQYMKKSVSLRSVKENLKSYKRYVNALNKDLEYRDVRGRSIINRPSLSRAHFAVCIQQRATLSSLQEDKVDTHKASTEATQQRSSIERITPKIEPGHESPCGSSDDQKKAAGKNQTVYISSSADERSPRYKYPHRYTFIILVCGRA
mgnify:CR=1 FL=1